MTTSYTSTSTSYDEFGTQMGEDFEQFSDYPVAFGITFTPKVTGIAAGIAGFLIAAYLVMSQILPAASELSQLRNSKQEKEQTLQSLQNSQIQVRLQQKQVELQQAKRLKQDVTNLFANPQTLSTLLLSINNFVNATNIKLNSYNPGQTEVVNTDDLGELAMGKVERQVYNLEFEGNFAQTQLFLQDIERLQPLIVISDLKTSVTDQQNYFLNQNQISVSREPQLKTTITINAISVADQPEATPTPTE